MQMILVKFYKTKNPYITLCYIEISFIDIGNLHKEYDNILTGK